MYTVYLSEIDRKEIKETEIDMLAFITVLDFRAFKEHEILLLSLAASSVHKTLPFIYVLHPTLHRKLLYIPYLRNTHSFTDSVLKISSPGFRGSQPPRGGT